MSAEPVRSFAGATAWLLLANVFRNLGLIALLILLARYTDSATVGRYSLSLAIATPVFVLAEMGLRTVYLTMHDAIQFRWYAAVRIAAAGAAGVCSTLISAIFAPDLTATVALVSLVKFADSCSDIFSGPLQHYDRTSWIAAAYAGLAVAGTAAVWAALAMTASLDVALASLLVVSAATALAMLLTARHRLRRAERAEQMHWRAATHRIIRAGLPTGFSWALLSLVSSVPQYFLAATHGQSAVGRFAVLLYIVAAVELFMNALTQSWIPSGRALLKSTPEPGRFARGVARTATLWTLMFLPLVIIGIWIAALLFPVIFGPSYAIDLSEGVAVAACVLVIPLVFFGSMALSLQNRWNAGIVLGLAAAATSLAACALLVAPFAVVGALLATLAAYATRAAVSFVLVNRVR